MDEQHFNFIEDCRLGIKLTLESCHKRQLGRQRWTKSRYSKSQEILNPIFLSCCACKHWLSDEEYRTNNNAQKYGHGFGRR